MDYRQIITYHGYSFAIKADDWPNEEAAAAAMIDLQMWAMDLDVGQTVDLHRALVVEATALIHEASYDCDHPPLPAYATHNAVPSELDARFVMPKGSSRQ